ncbi:hypothetical protein TK78_06680 [Streptomyces sp. Tue 6075]|nr:hypothetical protein TK78_06680 [Streptomyces sp. Tue 6075]APS18670.1 hypothetical protein TK78_06680 [Streptomyces sp. Tue 6075]
MVDEFKVDCVGVGRVLIWRDRRFDQCCADTRYTAFRGIEERFQRHEILVLKSICCRLATALRHSAPSIRMEGSTYP